MKRLLKNEGGFTLIELLVVIVIIGILATAGGMYAFNAKKKSNDGVKKADISVLVGALNEYNVSEDSFPLTGANWQQELIDAGTTLKEIKVSPVAGDDYTYVSDGTTFTLTVDLQNTTDSDVKNIGGVYTVTD